jgi:hypothetical protein
MVQLAIMEVVILVAEGAMGARHPGVVIQALRIRDQAAMAGTAGITIMMVRVMVTLALVHQAKTLLKAQSHFRLGTAGRQAESFCPMDL